MFNPDNILFKQCKMLFGPLTRRTIKHCMVLSKSDKETTHVARIMFRVPMRHTSFIKRSVVRLHAPFAVRNNLMSGLAKP